MTNPTEIVARAIFDAADKQDYVSYYRFHDGDTCLDGHFNLDRIAEAAIAAHLTALSEESVSGMDLPLEDARQEHIDFMVQAAADWLSSDDTAYELEPVDAMRVAKGMLQAAFSVVPGPNVLRGPVDLRGQQEKKP